jgi:GTP-binding protein HflX
LSDLVARLGEAMSASLIESTLLVPYDRPDVVARLHREADVLSTDDVPEGTRMRVRLDERLRNELADLAERRGTRVIEAAPSPSRR